MRALRASVLSYVAIAILGCAGIPVALPGGAAGGTGGTVTPGSGSVATDVIQYTNDARARNGLPPLSANAKLLEAARIQAQQMAQYQRADHNISGAQYPDLTSRP